MPTGGTSATRLVPCARCCSNPKSNTSSGTKSTPPPTPNNPAATPTPQATTKIRDNLTRRSSTGFFLPGLRPRFEPQQSCRHQYENSECALQIARIHLYCDFAAEISAE